jgi:hypothetical protein
MFIDAPYLFKNGLRKCNDGLHLLKIGLRKFNDALRKFKRGLRKCKVLHGRNEIKKPLLGQRLWKFKSEIFQGVFGTGLLFFAKAVPIFSTITFKAGLLFALCFK